jgi:hypothetical protein
MVVRANSIVVAMARASASLSQMMRASGVSFLGKPVAAAGPVLFALDFLASGGRAVYPVNMPEGVYPVNRRSE